MDSNQPVMFFKVQATWRWLHISTVGFSKQHLANTHSKLSIKRWILKKPKTKAKHKTWWLKRKRVSTHMFTWSLHNEEQQWVDFFFYGQYLWSATVSLFCSQMKPIWEQTFSNCSQNKDSRGQLFKLQLKKRHERKSFQTAIKIFLIASKINVQLKTY